MLATVVWDGGLDGNGSDFHDPFNWAGDVLPEAGDTAVIDATGTNPTISLTGVVNEVAIQSSRNVQLDGGTILGGRYESSGSGSLVATWNSGTIEGVTLAGDLDVSNGSVIVAGGITLENATIRIGDAAGEFIGRLFLSQGTQSIVGSGEVVFGGGNGNLISVGRGDASDVTPQDTITIGREITIHGQNGRIADGFDPFGETQANRVVNRGVITADGPGSIEIALEALVNEGLLRAANDGLLRVKSPFVSSSDSTARFMTSAGATLQLADSLAPATTSTAAYRLAGKTIIVGGSADQPRRLEAMSRDLAATAAGFATNNFALGRLVVAKDSHLVLQDVFDNAAGTEAEAVYVDSLVVERNATLDLSGLKLYAKAATITGTVIGTIRQVADGGQLTFGAPASGAVAQAGELDEWTFQGLQGRALGIVMNTDSVDHSGAPAPLYPRLQHAMLTLVAPDGSQVAQSDSAADGRTLVIDDLVLPMTGVYTLRVRAGSQGADATGNYTIAAYDFTGDTAPLILNQPARGSIDSPFDIDRWTLSLAANQQIRFDRLAASSPALRFTLTGPDGYQPFVDVSASTEAVTIPIDKTGPYVLTASGGTGAYSFGLRETTVTDLPLDLPVTGNLAGTGAARLYKFMTTSPGPIVVELEATRPESRVSLFLKRGAPPTRTVYDATQAESPASSAQILLPSAAAGDWYLLVYADAAAAADDFTLEARAEDLLLGGMAPASAAATTGAVVTVVGAGFRGSLSVTLRDGTGVVRTASAVEIDTLERLTATFDLTGVPVGTYSLGVERAGKLETLADAFRVVEQTEGRLETRLIVPPDLGRTGVATLYVEYANTGTAPLVAPIIQLASADPDDSDKPILTLSQHLLRDGFWSEVLPAGFGHSVSFLAAGAQPGMLNPGERIRVPVYYTGLLRPWDFSDGRVELGLTVIRADDRRPMNWEGMTYAIGRYHSRDIDDYFVPPLITLPWEDGSAPTYTQLRDQYRGRGISINGIEMRSDVPGVLQSRPEWVSAAAWGAIVANMRAAVGPTLGDYVKALSANAAYLARQGITENDIGRLWSFEILQASAALGPGLSLGAAVDAAMPGPGVPLAIGRSFVNTIPGRHAVGIFGNGWASTWDVVARTAADGTVTIGPAQAGGQRYEPDTRAEGRYLSMSGDTSTLRKSGGVLSLTDEQGAVTTFDTAGRIVSVTDRYGNAITATYDTGGRLTALVHSTGSRLTIAYNAFGRVASITDSAGRQTTYAYDAAGDHLLSRTDSDGLTTTYTYDTSADARRRHALTSITAGGVTRHYQYDALGRLATTHLQDGDIPVTYAYDSAGAVTTTTPAGSGKAYFDASGRLVKAQDPRGEISRFVYDVTGRLVRSIAPTGDEQALSWDRAGKLTSLTDEAGFTTSFAYAGPYGQVSAIVDVLGRQTRYEYDALGRSVATVYADGSRELAGRYTAQGLPGTTTDRSGRVTTVTFTSLGQPDLVTYADGSTVDYDYDALGNVDLIVETSASGASRETDYQYEVTAAGTRLTKVAYSDGRYVAYAYDSFGRRASLSDSTGAVTTYAYDGLGRLSKVVDGSGTAVAEYLYDAAGRLARVNKGNGTFTTYAYDAGGQLLSLVNRAPETAGGAANSRFDYAYDARGRRIGMATLDGTWTYGYDATAQLTTARFASTNPAIPDQDLRYEYDALGNRTRTTLNGVVTEYVANAMNQYTTVGGVAQTYDANGNLTFDGVNTFTYDVCNRLVKASGPQGVSEYEYDALGNRIAATVNGVRTEYLFDPFSAGGAVAEFAADGSVLGSTKQAGGLIATLTRTGVDYYDFDILGSVVGVTSLEGLLQRQASYGPFGNTLIDVGGDAARILGFVGQFGVLSLAPSSVGMGMREYDPDTGRFLQADPMRFLAGDANFYRYVSNSPVGQVDPSGLYVAQAVGVAWAGATSDSNGEFVGKVTGMAVGKSAGTIAGRVYGVEIGAVLGSVLGPAGAVAGGIYGGLYGPVVGGWVGGVVGGAIGGLLGGLGDRTPTDPNELPLETPFLSPSVVPSGPSRPAVPSRDPWDNLNDPNMFNPFPPGVTPPPPPLPPETPPVAPNVPNAVDPNEKLSVAGFGPGRAIRGDTTIPYRINFENIGPGTVDPRTGKGYDTVATAPAQRVTIADQLPSELDWTTFRLAEMGFGDTIVAIPANRLSYDGVVSMAYNGKTFDVELSAGIDPATGQVSATFQSIDPATGFPPDVLTGFLPPEDGTGIGMGFVSFTIRPKADLPTGTVLKNVALISFDRQTVIATNQSNPFDPQSADPNDPVLNALNTIDNTPPVAPAFAADNGFPTGSGVFAVSGLEAGATWAWSLDAGLNWMTGQATRFQVPVGTYAAGAVLVRQTDGVGWESPATASTEQFVIVGLPSQGTAIVVDAGQVLTDDVTRTGDLSLIKRGLGTLTLDRANSHSGGTVVEAGQVIVRNIGALGTGTLDVRAGAKVTLDVGSANWNGGTNFASLAGLVLDPGGRLEIGTGQIRVAAGGYDLAAIRSALSAGRNDGMWNGSTGFTSAAASGGPSRAIGYRVLPDGSLQLGFAAAGDLDMNGVVDVNDATALMTSGLFDTGLPATWAEGDYDYNGVLDMDDVIAFVTGGMYDQGPYLPSASGPTSQAQTASDTQADTIGKVTFEVGDAAIVAASSPVDSSSDEVMSGISTPNQNDPLMDAAFAMLSSQEQSSTNSAERKKVAFLIL